MRLDGLGISFIGVGIDRLASARPVIRRRFSLGLWLPAGRLSKSLSLADCITSVGVLCSGRGALPDRAMV